MKQVKVETSNLVHSIVRDKSHPSDNKIATRGCGGCPTVFRGRISKVWDPPKFGTRKASNFKFGIRINHGKSHVTDDKIPLKRIRVQGLFANFFLFWHPCLNLELVKLETSRL